MPPLFVKYVKNKLHFYIYNTTPSAVLLSLKPQNHNWQIPHVYHQTGIIPLLIHYKQMGHLIVTNHANYIKKPTQSTAKK